jgi:hypothetical protein
MPHSEALNSKRGAPAISAKERKLLMVGGDQDFLNPL